MSGYVSIGGKIGKWQYNALPRRVADGYRDNAKSDAQAQFISVQGQLEFEMECKSRVGSQHLYLSESRPLLQMPNLMPNQNRLHAAETTLILIFMFPLLPYK